jgi:hypothetical protein
MSASGPILSIPFRMRLVSSNLMRLSSNLTRLSSNLTRLSSNLATPPAV